MELQLTRMLKIVESGNFANPLFYTQIDDIFQC